MKIIFYMFFFIAFNIVAGVEKDSYVAAFFKIKWLVYDSVKTTLENNKILGTFYQF